MIGDLVTRAVSMHGLPVDDVLALTLPLLAQVAETHDVGRVAPLRGLDSLLLDDDAHRITFDPALTTAPRLEKSALAAVERQLRSSAAIDVRRSGEVRLDVATGRRDEVLRHEEGSTRVALVPGWQRWEHRLGHHDALTDVGSLGELLVALLCGLDLTDEEHVLSLDRHRRNLFALAPTLHPVVAAVVTSMVEPDRHQRLQDLRDALERLRTYRDQPEDLDLERVIGAGGDRRSLVLRHLRERLFDLSRRNPLLHFRATGRTLNLTQASVPLVLDVRSIRPEQLFTWGGATARRLVAGTAVDLGSVVRWDDAPYAEQTLDAVIAAARRDRAEYGQDQLRLVVAFLRWYDVHDDPDQELVSPLLLAAAEVSKRRGVRKSYRLQLVAGAEAEVNPVLRHQLRERYGLELPATVDLSVPDAVDSLRAEIERQGRSTERGLTITLVSRPRIDLIRSRAQTAVQAYRRRRSGARPTFGRRHYAYSYTRPSWQPLGVQIVADRLLRSPLPLAVELGDAPTPRQAVVGAGGEVEREVYDTVEADTNPYAWEVDLCSVTLANFNYRTLSLVRDYDALLDDDADHPVFDELFSTEPRQLPVPVEPTPLADRHLVVSADDSQLVAIAQARADDNFVIQGPPGTGKSQTITNLVADYLARGKRVLFVCQKRAALDVVHARLRSRGLDEICTLVHDSQADKKAFVHGLKATYEAWVTAADDLETIEAARLAVVDELTSIRSEAERYDLRLVRREADALRVVDVVDRLVALRDHRWGDDLSVDRLALLPNPAAWLAARPGVDLELEAHQRVGLGPVVASGPLAVLTAAAVADPRAELAVGAAAEGARPALARVRELLERAAPDGADVGATTLDAVRWVAYVHAVVDPLARHDALSALKPRSAAAGDLKRSAGQQQAALVALEQATSRAAGWRTDVAPAELAEALAVARRKERAPFRFLSGEWRRVRDLVAAGYDGGAAALPPSQALALLGARHDAQAAVDHAAAEAEQVWGHADLPGLVEALDRLRGLTGPASTWRDHLVGADDAPREALDDLALALRAVDESCGQVLDLAGVTLDVAEQAAVRLASPAGRDAVRAVAPAIRDLAGHPEALRAVRLLAATPLQLEHAVLLHDLRRACAESPELDTLDGARLATLVERASALEPELHLANARAVVGRLRSRFRELAEHSTRSVTGMSEQDRALKKAWAAGRRELEHEFGKVRAYKSIRQLSGGDPGAVVAALRPVWLMSPSSLSDTLDLVGSFDLVVFDEASQVPVEEAVPALHRASQVVVVGDRMQLPPTRYFRSSGSGGGSDGVESDDDDETQVGVVLDADSFLAVASTRLPSTMLLWHYRSRDESLIQFSNAAFYDGRLATVPDRHLAPVGRPRLVVRSGDDGPDAEAVRSTVDQVLDRPISVVRVADGVYANRTNPAEARWVAEIVRELVMREAGGTIGVVAFSEAQQGEIEAALAQLADADSAFAAAYEAELDREDDGQAVGLFVKNLENVQGDERDVIVMSVCYAAGSDGRMRMNFGPINNSGGEKRLNVIFSRARERMVLVSSIEPSAITNTYNDGAAALRGFLAYADAVSEGDAAAMAAALGPWHTASGRGAGDAPDVVTQLAEGLVARGVEVAVSLGQSGFRCDLALRATGAAEWHTAVLVDHASRVDAGTSEQRRAIQPAVLRAAGWRVEQVLGTEWLEAPDAVLDRLVAGLDG